MNIGMLEAEAALRDAQRNQLKKNTAGEAAAFTWELSLHHVLLTQCSMQTRHANSSWI